MQSATDRFLPLPAATLHILLSLAGEQLYGHAILLQVAQQSNGRHKMGPGTLYDHLQRLMRRGLVEEASGQPRDDGARRRYYRLSGLGRGVLCAEMDRLRDQVDRAAVPFAPSRPGRA